MITNSMTLDWGEQTMIDPDHNERLSRAVPGAKPRPSWSIAPPPPSSTAVNNQPVINTTLPPVVIPSENVPDAARVALQALHDDLYAVLCLFWRGVHPGEPLREGRIKEADLYAMHDRLSEIRRTFHLEDRC